jgi:CBS domain containing-hemolysin-like protein
MGVLLLCSGFFSLSEAAWFYLSPKDRRHLSRGNRAQRMAAAMLDDPDRLLTLVLFGNLMVNVAYFAVASIVSLQLERTVHATAAGSFAAGSLLVLIVFGEMLPKSLGVLKPRAVATLLAVAVATVVRAMAPVLPALRMANVLSLRVFWPGLRPEPYLRLGDLERAVDLSTNDAALLEQEQTILQRIVLLSEIRVDELMRPRTRFRSFRPPVSLTDMGGRMTSSGYMLVTEPDSDEVAAALDLQSLSSIPASHLERHAEAVVYVPWSTSVAAALESMRKHDRQVAVVINELGETIGVLTFEDILDTVFTRAPSRSQRLLKRVPICPHAPGVWHVTGMTSLRRLSRYFRVESPPSKSLTVSGVMQEMLERLPRTGDRCRWGPFELAVIDVPERGQLLVELTLEPREGPDE